MRTLLLSCLLSAAVLLGTPGCTSTPPTEHYRVQPPRENMPEVTCKVDARVTVRPFQASGPYDQKDIVYRRQPYRVYFDRYRKWTSLPARMVQQACIAWLRESGLFSTVTSGDESATYAVEGRVVEFYELDEKGARHAVVRLELSLVNRKGTTLFTIYPEHRVQAPPAEDLSGLAEAMSEAVAKAMRDFIKRAEEEFCPGNDGPG
jgi:ABC-type uncharacterized transport system auxiliary subunit